MNLLESHGYVPLLQNEPADDPPAPFQLFHTLLSLIFEAGEHLTRELTDVKEHIAHLSADDFWSTYNPL